MSERNLEIMADSILAMANGNMPPLKAVMLPLLIDCMMTSRLMARSRGDNLEPKLRDAIAAFQTMFYEWIHLFRSECLKADGKEPETREESRAWIDGEIEKGERRREHLTDLKRAAREGLN